ncbi:RNA polymerase sigma factor [Mycobacterium antarcticum]|uniref:RNA polymerase sigma factor n=1 Tax=Mycolicibacterium sp. TUM20984 TaxID=3023368 RepID=UPI0023940CC8|nr:sigma-70 family RNA polymerase sigma factor [Mycolicibacterium sp. TUM20984]GLP81369.1 RNA polymerase sigma24 factor [Mycolicibacterium sp. TUM20984]
MSETAEDEALLVAALRAGDERAFARLVDRYAPSMLRVARGYVPSHEVAEDVVQETWIALLGGISKFEGRSSVRTWLFAVLVNIAKNRGIRERRTSEGSKDSTKTVDSRRFRPANDPEWPGHWKEEAEPSPFPDTPEGSALGAELVAVAQREIDRLPERQRVVVTMRDVLGLDSDEVCELLDLSVGNQRVLLHRGRAMVRAALESYLQEEGR